MIIGDGGAGPIAPPARDVLLPGGHHLMVRPAGPDDLGALLAFYDGLGSEDRQRRFFTSAGPPLLVVEQWLESPGGLVLLAVVQDGAAELVVGEAGYSLLQGGDGELGIAVLDGWRGWLGPFLLDSIIEAAAARGVPNLQADVLVTNRPMLAITKRRGAVTIEHPDAGTVRLRFPTTRGPLVAISQGTITTGT